MKDLLRAPAPVLEDLLPYGLYKQVLAVAEHRRYNDGQLIHTRGTEQPGMSIVYQGAVRVGIVGLDGSYLNTSQLGVGQCFGEHTVFAELPRTHDVTAIGDTELKIITKSKLLTLVEDQPALARSLLTISLVRLHGLLEFMDDLRRLPLDVRVAKFVYGACDSQQSLDVRQEDLSFTFGVSRVSMGKALKSLERKGLLSLGYGKIEIPNEGHLKIWLEQKLLVEPLRMGVITI